MTWRAGIDIGGTFTDLVARHDDGRLLRAKVPSTPRRPQDGFLAALRALLEAAAPEDVRFVAHATTLATNALLGQTDLVPARVAFVTTAGFRDVIEIGRQNRSSLYDLDVERATPLAKREDRFGVRERMTYDGRVLTALSRDDVNEAAAAIRERGIATVAIGFLHADVDGSHEREAAAILRAALPEARISLSSEVDPQYREYERFSTTVVNAALAPIVRTYLDAVAVAARAAGVTAPVFVMRSDGGMASLATAAQRPAALIESGPASGAIAAAAYARELGLANILSFDMGGTTAKAGAVFDGSPELCATFEAAGTTHSGRTTTGSGYPVRFPFVDLAEIGAGGGTIARLDAAGVLRVGPAAAGVDPGPACYGRGDEPTVTDADVVLGRIEPHALAGGTFAIDAARARAAFERVAAPFVGDAERAAVAAVAIVDAQMAKVVRIVSVERGYDPRDFALVAFGGGGPLHACAVASELGVRRIVIPPHPGVFSACGLLVADIRTVAQRSLVAPANRATWQQAERLAEVLGAEAVTALAAQDVTPERRSLRREFELRYAGQSHAFTIADPPDLDAALARFHDVHARRFGFSTPEEPVELVTVRAIGIGRTPNVPGDARATGNARHDAAAVRATRRAFDGHAFVDMPVLPRELVPKEPLAGPLLLEQYDTTTFVAPGWIARAAAAGALVIEDER